MSGSTTLTGIGVSPGVAYASALVVRLDFPDVPDRGVSPSEVESELGRLHAAVEDVVARLESLRQRVLERAGEEESRIFDAQIMMVQDKDFLAGVEILIPLVVAVRRRRRVIGGRRQDEKGCCSPAAAAASAARHSTSCSKCICPGQCKKESDDGTTLVNKPHS